MALIVKNGLVVIETGMIKADIKIVSEKIAEIKECIDAEEADCVIDAEGKYVLPGVIDSHVHYKMPLGKVYTIDNFQTGSRSAACGGVTTFVDYADPLRGKTLVESLDYRRHEAEGKAFIDGTFHMVIENTSPWDKASLQSLKDYGVNSLKLFTTYGQNLSYEEIGELLKTAKEIGLVVTVHAEDDKIVTDKIAELKEIGKTAPSYHAVSRPSEAEVVAVKKLIELSKKYDAHVHIVHVSSGDTAEVIRQARQEGVKITAETCPHYLILNDSVYQREDAQMFIMQPPLRTQREADLLWENVRMGTFAFFTTDHCAYCEGQKKDSDTFFETNGGIPGSETLLPVLFSEGVSKGRLLINDLVDMLSTNPAKMFGLYPQKGTIRVGSDGDLVIIDPNKEVVLSKDILHSAADYSTFEGMELKGYPVATILRGKLICQDNRFLMGEPEGKFISCNK